MTRLAIAATDVKRRTKTRISRERQERREGAIKNRIPTSQRTPRRLQQNSLPEMPFIELYQNEDSSGSHRVRKRLTELGLDFVAHVVPDDHPLKRKQLVQAGGLDQVPFLIDHRSGTKLYESGAILKYLDHEYGKEQKSAILRMAQRADRVVRSRADQLAWAIKRPLDRLIRLRQDADEILETGRGTLRMVKEVFTRSTRGKTTDQAA